MEFQCPINYYISGTKDGAVSSKKYYFREFVTVSIAEISSAEAPVAVRWRPAPRTPPSMYSRQRFSDTGVVGPDGYQHTRWYNGRHWQRLCHGHLNSSSAHHTGTTATPALTVDDLAAALMRETYHESATSAVVMGLGDELHEVACVSGSQDVNRDPSADFSSIRRSDRPEKVDRLQEAVASLIVVDGVLHRRSMEPFVSVCHTKHRALDPHLDIAIETTPRQFWDQREAAYNIFAIPDWDRAVATALDGTSAVQSLAHFAPEILIADSIARDHESSTEVGLVLKGLLASLRLAAPVHGPYPHRNITRAMYSQDLDEQFELLSAIPADIVTKWKKSDKQQMRDALLLLEDRVVSVPVETQSPSPIMR
ncbi:hypothetical protein [Rhizobium sp. BK176]|uniref:hypothetical protein n=1 Tax=Rhizobium sp. BK176 TaxID=2587071 RepID=UPI0021694AE1|nr:hypothetical protein [Rhizobium sp. BK176]MCS4089163.1 hypothetical protein [Rhizobium sp. BK176]